ncbi:hypothetical protein HanRHA438_Chr08g0362181 [Helianthus annuus]|nr:hypothetical protein HanHA89_Chr08g0307121 [Helianthus annuus]KAJ0719973.1 hypothetical protein HanLR1_Chr08g0287821 [Helianthus annuus]KAJ0898907.1 hypothetical protein HanRHA438_Chr08g0362181 [Helianthus annuus]
MFGTSLDLGAGCRLYGFFLFEVGDVPRYHKMARGNKKWKNAVYTIMQTAVWVIWKARNEAIFKGKQPRVSSLIEEIKVLGYLWFKSRAKAYLGRMELF